MNGISAELPPASAVAALAVRSASQRECETFAVWRRDRRVFIVVTSKLCERAFAVRILTPREEGQVAGLESPNGLGAPVMFSAG